MKKKWWIGVMLAGGLALNPLAGGLPVSTKVVEASSDSLIFQKQFKVSDLVNGKVLQQNPKVVVTSVGGGPVRSIDPYLYVLEYVG